MQKAKLATNIDTLAQQARRSLESNREDLARVALERKNMLLTQSKELDRNIGEIEKEQIKLENAERRLSSKIEEFKTRKEMIKAQYSAAEAQVKIKESVTGISQFKVNSEILEKINGIDNSIVDLIKNNSSSSGDSKLKQKELQSKLSEMKNLVISNGQYLDDKEIVESDVIFPDHDLY
jgi:phage shock protein A